MKFFTRTLMLTALVAVVFTSCKKEEAPVASFSANKTVVQLGESVTFTDNSSNDPATWGWIFEGATPYTSNEQNPTVTYTTAGKHSVTLVVSNETGDDTKTVTDYIEVLTAEPVVSFSVSESVVNPGTEVTLFDESTGEPTSWAWTITDPDGSDSYYSTKDVTKTLNTIGYYTVQLDATNEHGTGTLTENQFIEVYVAGVTVNNTTPDWIKVFFNGSYKSCKYGESVKVTDEDGDGYVTYYIETWADHGQMLSTDPETVAADDSEVDYAIDSDWFHLTYVQGGFTIFDYSVVNEGLEGQYEDNISITAFSDVVKMGYYKLWSNTTVKASSSTAGQYWQWSNINWYGSENITLELTLEDFGKSQPAAKIGSTQATGNTVKYLTAK